MRLPFLAARAVAPLLPFALLLLAIATVILIAVDAALAQEPDTRVNFDPFIAEVLPYLMTFLAAVFTAAIAWASKKLNDWTGIQIEAKHREALQSALLNGARTAIASNMPSGIGLDVRSVSLKAGIEFVLASVPDAVEYFGLSPADIEKHLIPKLSALSGESK